MKMDLHILTLGIIHGTGHSLNKQYYFVVFSNSETNSLMGMPCDGWDTTIGWLHLFIINCLQNQKFAKIQNFWFDKLFATNKV